MRVFHLLPTAHAVNNLALSRMKVARYEELNDPFELLAGDTSDRQSRKVMYRVKADLNSKAGILSFSKHWKNPVLWSHYADKHRGIALGFDLGDDYAVEVTYIKERIQIQNQNTEKKNRDLTPLAKTYKGTKFEHWRYEEEVRFHVDLNECYKDAGLYFYSLSEELQIKQVILGPLCSIGIERIQQLVTNLNLNVEIIKSRLAFKKFEVVTNQKY
jgi:hypothetical protein